MITAKKIVIPESVKARLKAESERTLSRKEVEAYLSAPVSEEERQNALALLRWFMTRYPTAAARLAYVRAAAKRWR